jgi:hypothetical protein
MAAKRKRTMEDEDTAHELFLESYSDAHTSKDEHSPHESDNDQEETD